GQDGGARGGKGLDVRGRPGELDQVAVTADHASGLRKDRAYVEVHDVRTDRAGGLCHGALELLADQVLAERREVLPGAPRETQQGRGAPPETDAAPPPGTPPP